MGNRLAIIDIGRKEKGAAVPLSGGGDLGPHLTQCGLGRGYLRTKWHLGPSSRLATTDGHGPKIGEGAVPLLGGNGSPSNTSWPWRETDISPSTKFHIADVCLTFKATMSVLN